MNMNYDTNIDNYNEYDLLKYNNYSSDLYTKYLPELTEKSVTSVTNINPKTIDAINSLTLPELTETSLTTVTNINPKIVDTINPVIINPMSSAINVNNTPYPQGVINPIEKKTFTKLINIDSMFRPNYWSSSCSDFMWNFIQQETNVVSMRVSSIDVPVAWYPITNNEKRNEIIISLYNMQTGGIWQPHSTQTLIIPPGNYMSDNFTNLLNLLFIKQGNGLEYLIADIDSDTSKTIIRAVTSDDITNDSTGLLTHAAFDPANLYYSPTFFFTLNFFPNKEAYVEDNQLGEFQRTVGWYLGFRKYKYTIKEADTVEQITYSATYMPLFYKCGIESESSYGTTRENYIFLSIDDFKNNAICQPIISSTRNSYIGDNILARITINSIPNTVTYDNGMDKIFKTREYMGPVTIEKLKITLLNKYGDVIDLNSNNISFTLELTKLY
jgi:hypothetical protein